MRAYHVYPEVIHVKLNLDTLLSCVKERYESMEKPARKRKRNAESDQYLDDLCAFTLRRVHASPNNKRKFSLQLLADDLEEKYGRRFHRSTLLRTLRHHMLYDLWS